MKFLKLLVTLILGILVGVGAWQGIQKTDLLRLKIIEIKGADPQTENRLKKITLPLIGETLWDRSLSDAASLIKDPWIESANLTRIFPNKLFIEVKERVPLAVIGDTKGRFSYIDDENQIIDRAQAEKIGRYPILLGKNFKDDTSLRKQALSILKSLPSDGYLSRRDLSDLRFDDEHGFQIRLSQTGILIDIGKENIPLHIDRARRVVQYLDQHSINATRVDSDYSKKVLVKVRKGR